MPPALAERMSRIGLGCYPLGGGYGRVSQEQAEATVTAAIECGWTFLDTAETYLNSEERLGKILKGKREKVFLATKAFPCEPYTPFNLRSALEASLRRLQTDHVDLYQLHGPENWVLPDASTPMEEVATGLAALRDEGKLTHVGLCNFDVRQVAELDSLLGVFSLQDLYSVIDPGVDEDLPNQPSISKKLEYTKQHDVRFIAYSPLARGLLSDDISATRTFPEDDERHYFQRYQPGTYEHFVTLATTLSVWAKERGHTLRQLAVAWCLHNPAVSSVLVGAKAPEQVHQIAGAERWILTNEDMSLIAQVVDALPEHAKAALVTTFDHFSSHDLNQRLCARRHSAPGPSELAWGE